MAIKILLNFLNSFYSPRYNDSRSSGLTHRLLYSCPHFSGNPQEIKPIQRTEFILYYYYYYYFKFGFARS